MTSPIKLESQRTPIRVDAATEQAVAKICKTFEQLQGAVARIARDLATITADVAALKREQRHGCH